MTASGLATFTAGKLADKWVPELAARMTYEVIEETAGEVCCGVRVTARDGRVIERWLRRSQDARPDFLSTAQIEEKFLATANAGYDGASWPPGDQRAIVRVPKPAAQSRSRPR